MAAGEDQPQAIVWDFAGVVIRLLEGRAEPGLDIRFNRFLKARAAPYTVDGLVAGGLDNPGARKFRDSGGAPLIYRSRKCFLRRLFGELEVAKQPNQRGDNPA